MSNYILLFYEYVMQLLIQAFILELVYIIYFRKGASEIGITFKYGLGQCDTISREIQYKSIHTYRKKTSIETHLRNKA